MKRATAFERYEYFDGTVLLTASLKAKTTVGFTRHLRTAIGDVIQFLANEVPPQNREVFYLYLELFGGHVRVWHSSSPGWVVMTEQLTFHLKSNWLANSLQAIESEHEDDDERFGEACHQLMRLVCNIMEAAVTETLQTRPELASVIKQLYLFGSSLDEEPILHRVLN
jgi:hypothetical protein